MTHLSEHEFRENESTAKDLQHFGTCDWLEAIVAHGVDDVSTSERVRYANWYNADTQARYKLKGVEVRDSALEVPYSWYYLQVYPEPDDNFIAYSYRSDTHQTLQHDTSGRVLDRGRTCVQWTEAELLAHLQTAPPDRWPDPETRLPSLVVMTRFVKIYIEEFGLSLSRQNLSIRLASLLCRLWRGRSN